MSDNTGIAWTQATWNPIRSAVTGGMVRWGCEKVSPGCDHCYASSLHERHGGQEYPKEGTVGSALERIPLDAWDKPRAGLEPLQLHDPTLGQPLRWARPRMIFVCSMTDLFGDWVPVDWIMSVFSVMERCSQHTFQVLTKRPKRMLELVRHNWPHDAPRNVWWGTSVESQAYAWRMNYLMRMESAAVTWVSAEPLLGPIDFEHAMSRQGRPIDWVVVGGESGRGYRPMDLDWAREIRDWCVDGRTAFFYKQSSSLRPGKDRELDGRLWEEYPAIR